MKVSARRSVVLRNGVVVDDPLSVALAFLESYGLGLVDVSGPATFGEADLRSANRDGARISAAEIAAILEHRGSIERALRAIAPETSLASAARTLPWAPLRHLFDAFADIRGVGFSKVTKTLHRKRPALIPILDSVVQRYLEDDATGGDAPFGERALMLVRAYKRDLDRNGVAVRATRRELARRGYELTDVRVLDLVIWSAETTPHQRP